MQPQPTIRVYTDGQCRLCLRARRFVERYDEQSRLEFRDYNDPEVARETPYSLSELAREMHVQEGLDWFAGYRAWIEVLKTLPRWRWVARVGWLWPLRWIGPALYRFVATNRYRFARWLQSSHGVDCRQCAVPRQG